MASLVNWDREVTVSTGTENDLELVMGVLTIDRARVGKQWAGKIVGATGKMDKLRAELRKTIHEANVLIIIGHSPSHDQSRTWGNIVPKERNIQISMNGKCHMLQEEMNEMNLAIVEAQNVLENIKSAAV